MIKFDLRDLVPKKPRRKTVRLRPIYPTLRAEQAYLKELRRMLKGLAAEVNRSVLPALSSYRQHTRDAQIQDWEGWFISLRQAKRTLVNAAKELANKIFGLESERHTDEFHKVAREALGIDISAIVRSEELSEYLADHASRNAGLITSLADETVKGVETLVLNAKLNGTTAKQLKEQLKNKFGIADKRARLIARDQTAKLTSDLNQLRQQQVGITEYVWRTSRDERVRPRHSSLDGEVYAWGKPTGAEEGLPPGKPIQCRCTAQAVVIF